MSVVVEVIFEYRRGQKRWVLTGLHGPSTDGLFSDAACKVWDEEHDRWVEDPEDLIGQAYRAVEEILPR